MEKQMEEQQLQQALQRSQMERLLQLQEEDRARRRAWEEEEARRQNEQRELEQRRWRALAVSNQMAINNAKVLHDQERHQRDYQAGLPYAEHSGWTNYPNLPHPQGPSEPTPHWPEAVGSSFIPIPYQPPPQGEQSPLDNYKEMFEALTDYQYQPNPPVNPNERYQR
ncbi:stress response protein nst1-like [Helianthus annuus]|uniref:stress response protein nst1-like n=1 Tax=Helianthus annuus TaxID=4232 RepID=UPI000B9009BB|nr:stress response protein nst1-like [Helianthus annuus]